MSTIVDDFIGERPVLPGLVAVAGLVGVDQSHALFEEDAAFLLLQVTDSGNTEAIIPIYFSINALPGIAGQLQDMHDLYTEENDQ